MSKFEIAQRIIAEFPGSVHGTQYYPSEDIFAPDSWAAFIHRGDLDPETFAPTTGPGDFYVHCVGATEADALGAALFAARQAGKAKP